MTSFEFYSCVFFFGLIVCLGLIAWQTKLKVQFIIMTLFTKDQEE